MTLRNFLDAAYALLVEDFQRVNPLLPADDVLEKMRAGLGMSSATAAPAAAVAPPAGVTVPPTQNDASMKMLTGMLSGVKGAPRMPRKTR